jgi:hypothetical protein
MRKLLLACLLASCKAPGPALPGDCASARLIRKDFCPEGYLLELENGSRLFADYLLYEDSHEVQAAEMEAIRNRSKVCIQYEAYPFPWENAYHSVDLACPQGSESPMQAWPRVRLLSIATQ